MLTAEVEVLAIQRAVADAVQSMVTHGQLQQAMSSGAINGEPTMPGFYDDNGVWKRYFRAGDVVGTYPPRKTPR